jgi:hypothetical protein
MSQQQSVQRSAPAADSQAESAGPSWQQRFRGSLAGLTYAEQLERVRPSTPLGVVQQRADSAATSAVVQHTTGTGGTPAPHPRQADLDADQAQITPVAGLRDFQTRVKSLKVVAKPGSVSSVDLKVTKFFDAVTRTKAQLVKPSPDGYGPADGPTKITEWIDNRVATVEGYLSGNFTTKAQAAHDRILASGAVNADDQLDVDWGVLVDFRQGASAFGPEELFAIGDLSGIKGVFKVYDVGKVFNTMKDDYKAAWNAVAARRGLTGQQLFIDECKAAGRMVYAPAGEGSSPPFDGANGDKVFSGQTVNAFVGLARDATATSFSDALTKYQLAAKYYPSGAMMAGQVGEDVLRSNWGSIQLGKPSIMNLLVFDENVYDETDRTFGHLADPADPSKPGANLELTILGCPLADFMRAGGTQVLT